MNTQLVSEPADSVHLPFYIHPASQIVMGVRGCIGKNPSPIEIKDKAYLECIKRDASNLTNRFYKDELGPI